MLRTCSLQILFILCLPLIGSQKVLAHANHNHSPAIKGKKVAPHSHSGIMASIGLQLSKAFGSTSDSSDSSTPSGGQDSHAGHQHLALHDGHSEGGGSSGSSSASSSSDLSTALVAGVGYRFSHALTLGLSEQYDFQAGVQDPALTLAWTPKVSKRLAWASSASATAPVSESSQADSKITTLSLSSGPQFSAGKWSLSAAAVVSSSWYSQTELTEDQADKVGAKAAGLHGNEDHAAATPSASNSSSSGTSLSRELNRYGAKSGLGYKILPNLSLGTGLGIALVDHQYTDQTYATEFIVSQATLTMGSVGGNLGLALRSETEEISAPDTPVISAGVQYQID